MAWVEVTVPSEMSTIQCRQESSPHICQNWKRKKVKDPKRELCNAQISCKGLSWPICPVALPSPPFTAAGLVATSEGGASRRQASHQIQAPQRPHSQGSRVNSHSWYTSLSVWRGASVAATEVGQSCEEMPWTLLSSWLWSLSMCTRPAWWLPSLRVCCNITLLLCQCWGRQCSAHMSLLLTRSPVSRWKSLRSP